MGIGLVGGLVYLFAGAKIAAAIIGLAMAVTALASAPASIFLLFIILAIEPSLPLIPVVGTVSKPAGILVLLTYLGRISQYHFYLDSMHKVLLLSLVFAAASILWSKAPSFALQGSITMALNLSIIIVIYNLIRSPAEFKIACAGMIVGATLAALMLKLGYGTVQQGTLSGTDSLSNRMTLGEENPVRIAYSMLLGWFAILYVCTWARPWMKVLVLGLGLFILYAMLATQSRTSLAAAVVVPALGYTLVADRRMLFKLLYLYAFLAIIGLALYYAIFYTDILPEAAKARMRRNPTEELTDSGRVYMWGQGLRMFYGSPLFGVGFKNFSPVIGIGASLASAHNNIVSLMAELGLIGLTFAGMAHYYLIKRIRQGKGTAIGWYAACLFSFTVLTGLTSTTYHKKHFWYALGFALVAASIAVVQKRSHAHVSHTQH